MAGEYSYPETTTVINIFTIDPVTLNLLRVVLNDRKNCKSEFEVVDDMLVVKTTIKSPYPGILTITPNS